MKNKFNDFYEAWWYLNETPVFELKNLGNIFEECLCIEVVKINPEINKIDDHDKLNTKVQIWLECGEPFLNENDEIRSYHNQYYDTGGDTFEKAIISLANIVWKENKK